MIHRNGGLNKIINVIKLCFIVIDFFIDPLGSIWFHLYALRKNVKNGWNFPQDWNQSQDWELESLSFTLYFWRHGGTTKSQRAERASGPGDQSPEDQSTSPGRREKVQPRDGRWPAGGASSHPSMYSKKEIFIIIYCILKIVDLHAHSNATQCELVYSHNLPLNHYVTNCK